MSDDSPDLIIARFDADAGQWSAYFPNLPQVAYGSDLPIRAVRRLLEGTEASPDSYELRCDPDQSGSSALLRSLIWDPPEMLFDCAECGGKGQYTGLNEVEPCKECGGRKVVPA